MTHKEQLREQMREARRDHLQAVCRAQHRVDFHAALSGAQLKDEALKDLNNALVKVKALRERHTSLRIQWEQCNE